jgi:hypothetical protein
MPMAGTSFSVSARCMAPPNIVSPTEAGERLLQTVGPRFEEIEAEIAALSKLTALVPRRYLAGKRQIEETFGVKVIETPNALRDPDWLYRNPKARADNLHWALRNDAVGAIFSTIGGHESVRILSHLDHELIPFQNGFGIT